MKLPRQAILISLAALLALAALLNFSSQMQSGRTELRLAQTSVRAGEWQSASRHYAAAAIEAPWRADLWALAGRYALESGDPQKAVEYLNRSIQVAGSGASNLPEDAWVNLGEAYRQQGDLPSALSAWQEALLHTGTPLELQELILQAQENLGDYPQAVETLHQMIASQQENAGLRFRLGLLLASQEPEAALDVLDEAGRLDPALASPVSTLRRAILSGRIGDDRAYSLVSTGRALAVLEEWPLAAEAFHQAALARPDYAEAWAYLGEALQHLPDASPPGTQPALTGQEALQALNKALELDPDSVAANSMLALYHSRNGQVNQALESIRKAVELEPQSPELNAQLGSILAQSGDFANAYFAYKKATELSPLEPKFYRLLAEFSAAYNYQTVEIGLPAARQAVILAPQDAASLDSLAQVLIKLGDLSSAERFLNQALQINPDYAPAYLHLAAIYLLRDEMENSRSALDQVLSLSPESAAGFQAQRLIEDYFP